MSFRQLIIIPLFLAVSCSQDSKEEPEPKPAPKQTEGAPEAIEPEAPKAEDPGLTFAVPKSTDELMTDEKKKTVIGPITPPSTTVEDDNAINVDPQKLHEVPLPDEG